MGAEEGGGGNAAAAIRIHVGGLGESVTSDDLQKIFSPMGSVHGIDFVRTKGRSFAYIDFSPSSDKSLTKLFSTYNGCVWKGGRLRFEKAKEHYLARLKREWEENAALTGSSPDDRGDVDVYISLSDKSNTEDLGQLKIFFPRLRKVKSVPFSGSGKHKYSFQRVEVPSLPTYFCDCEDHFRPHTPQVKRIPDLESQNGGINGEELNIMNSVMSKLFQRECHSESVHGKDGLDHEDDEHELDFEQDEDNLIINMVSTGNSRLPFSRNRELETASRKRKPILNEKQTFRERGMLHRDDGERKNGVHPSKKRKSIIDEGNGRKESTPPEHDEHRESSQPGAEASRTKSVVGFLHSEPVVNHATGSTSSRKASWKALVANGKNTTFSVSSVLSSIASKEEDGTDLPTQASAVLNESNGSSLVDGSTKDVVKKQKSKMSQPTKKARKSILGDLEVRNAFVAAESVGRDKSETHANVSETDSILEAEPAVQESGTKQSAIKHSLQESSCEALVGDLGSNPIVSSQLAGVTSIQEDQSGLNNLGLAKDEEGQTPDIANDKGQTPDIAMKKNVDRESANEEIRKGAESQPVQPEGASNRSGRGSAWLQKSSWTQMVSQNSTFSITQLVPGLTSENYELTGPNSVHAAKSSNSIDTVEPVKRKSSEDSSTAMGIAVVQSNPDKSRQNVVGKDESFIPLIHEERNTMAKKIVRRNCTVGETCSFMRNAASLKEWAKAKKALREPRKRKNNEN